MADEQKGDVNVTSRIEPHEHSLPTKIDVDSRLSNGYLDVRIKAIGGERRVRVPFKAPVHFGFDGENLMLCVAKYVPVGCHVIGVYAGGRVAVYDVGHDYWKLFDPEESVRDILDAFPEEQILYDNT